MKYKLVENTFSGRVHILHDNGLTYCSTRVDDDYIYRHSMPKHGIACGSCLRVRRRMRRPGRVEQHG